VPVCDCPPHFCITLHDFVRRDFLGKTRNEKIK